MSDQNIVRFTYKHKEIILIGTSHISQVSADLVQKVIQDERPDVVCVELDEKRAEKYLQPEKWASMDIIRVIKDGRLTVLFANIVYSAYQRKLAKELGTKAGGEMLQALKSADEIGAKIELIDRDAQVTFKRMWRSLGFFQKPRLFTAFFSEFDESSNEDISSLLDSETFDTVFLSVKDKFPTVYKDMISDRDLYMAGKIEQIEGNKVVAVVGKGHLKGIQKDMGKKVDLTELESIPKKKLGSRLVDLIFPLLIVTLLILSFVSGTEVGMNQLFKWFLWNGGLAALFTLLALGHPLTIVVSFLCAPIGALSPVLSVGVFSAITEATLRKPVVNDFLTVQDDLSSWKKMLNNKLLRIMLVFIFANTGGAIGNIIGGLDIIKNLF